MTMDKVVVALDWTTNTNHSGFYLAKARGLYSRAGLDVQLRSPHVDAYHATPASLLSSGAATFAITPSETVLSYNTWPEQGKQRPKVKAVATLLQDDLSAVVTLKSSGLDRPKDLDGKVYASYGARFEGRIVQALIKADGGKGEFVESTPPMLDIWGKLMDGTADATWVFMAWEGVQAQLKGVDLNAFHLRDYGIKYGYSPLLIATDDTVSSRADVVRRFLAATEEGYKAAAQDPEGTAAEFMSAVEAEHKDKPLPQPLDPAVVSLSMQRLAKEYLTPDGRWGAMEANRWEAFLDWLSDSGLLTTKVQSREPDGDLSTSLDGLRGGDVGQPIPRSEVHASDMFTNELLPK